MSKKKDSKKKGVQKITIDDGKLTINCEGCKGASSVVDRDCILCMCRNVLDAGNVSSITLSSAMEVSIRGDAVEAIRDLAFVHRLMTENRSERKGKKCNRCKNSFTMLVRDQVPVFPEIDIPLLRGRMAQMQFSDPVCTLCAGDTLRLIDTLEITLAGIAVNDSSLEKEVE